MKKIFNLDSKFTIVFGNIVNLLILNVMFILTSIPLVSIGPSLVAMHHVTSKLARGDDVYIIKTYLKTFKENFNISIATWLLIILGGLIIYSNISFVNYLSGIPYIFLFMVLAVVMIIYLILLSSIFYYIARFNNSLKESIFNTIQISLVNLHYCVLLVLITIGPWIIILSTPITIITGIYFFTFGGFAFFSFVKSYILKFVYSKYEDSKE